MDTAGGIDVAGILATDTWYRDLPASLQQALVKIGVPRRLQAGQRLFSRGDAVLEGRLAAIDVSEHGDESVQLHLEPVSWFGEMGLYDRLPRVHHIRAEQAATVLWLSDVLLREHLKREPEHWFHFGLLLTQKLRLALFVLEGRKVDSNDLRVARILLMLAQSALSAKGETKQRVSIQQQEVAEMLGMSRQTVNQALQRLKAEGLLQLAYNKVEITDLEALRAKVHFENWLPLMRSAD